MGTLSVLNTLFLSLICFVTINTVLSLFLWRSSRYRIYRLMLKFWISNIIYLGIQFFYPVTKNEIVLAYAFGVLPMFLAYTVVCEILKREPRYKPFILFTLVTGVVTLILLSLDVSFTIAALPFALALSYPLVMAVKMIFIDHKKEATPLQKALGVVFIVWIIQCLNFAFFRMMPNAPLYGWIGTYALLDVLAIILPAISIEEHQRTERARLQKLVTQRTADLSNALNDKENLLRILIHDISTPLTVMRWYLTSLKNNPAEKLEKYFDKIQKSQETVENIVKKVKELQTQSSSKLSPISVSKSTDELVFLFEQSLAYKNLKLEIKDSTSPSDLILGDQFTLTHNVLSNLISNAIKFSFPDTSIILSIYKQNESLIVSIKDHGIGMEPEAIQKILNNSPIQSTPGTQGEYGTGYGLGIVSTLLRNFKGCLKIESIPYKEGLRNHGTTMTITFPLI